MAFGATPKDSGGIPIGAVYVANSGFKALQASPVVFTDGSGNVSSGAVMLDAIENAIMLGNAFAATTGLIPTATNANLVMGSSLFNPSASGKNVYVYSAEFNVSVTTGNTTLQLRALTADPAYTTVLIGQNLRGGSAIASVASVTSAASGATASISTPGTQQDIVLAAGIGTYDFIPLDQGLFLPSGTASGVGLYATIAVAAQTWGVSWRWIEF